MKQKPSIKVLIYTPQELNHSSYVQTGLFELEREGFIECKVVLRAGKCLGRVSTRDGVVRKTKHPQPKTSFYKMIDRESGRSVLFAADLYDVAHFFSEFALEHCQYVFKRSFETRCIDPLPAAAKNKIHPLGLTFGLLSKNRRLDALFFWGMLLSNLRLSVRRDRIFVNRIISSARKSLRHWRFTRSARYLEDFVDFSPASDNKVLFQTRCFVHENRPDVRQIHEQRFRLIMRLRERVNGRFLGGLVPSRVARQKYSDALTNLPTDARSYLQLVKKARVGVYTRGLEDSPAWKLPEYLSQGKAVVAERLTTELPVSLEGGRDVLFFDDESECVDLVERLLGDRELAEYLSANARTYFVEHVHPAQNIRRILNLMLAQQT